MGDLLLILIGTALANRLLLRRSTLLPGRLRPLQHAGLVALASLFTLILTLGVAALLETGVPALTGVLAWLLAIVPAVLATGLWMRRAMAQTGPAPGLLALLAINATALGLGLQGLGTAEGGLLLSLLQGLAAGLGFGLLLLLFTAQDERLAATAVPAPLRGVPLLLLGAAVLLLAVQLGLREP